MRELSLEELLDGCRKAIANARELLEEADLLSENEHYARAYFAAHIACEEMAKAPMLHRAAYELTLGLSPDWRKLDRRLRDHEEKIRNVFTMEYFQSDVRPDNSDLTAYQEDLDRVPLENQAKNHSLYVGLEPEGFVQPSARFDRETAEAMVALRGLGSTHSTSRSPTPGGRTRRTTSRPGRVLRPSPVHGGGSKG